MSLLHNAFMSRVQARSRKLLPPLPPTLNPVVDVVESVSGTAYFGRVSSSMEWRLSLSSLLLPVAFL